MLVFIQLLFPLFLSVLTVGLPFRRICINISRRHGNSICSPNGSCSRIWITIIYEILFWFRVLCVCFVTLCSSMHEMRCHSISLLYVEEALRKPMDFDEVKFAKKNNNKRKLSLARLANNANDGIFPYTDVSIFTASLECCILFFLKKTSALLAANHSIRLNICIIIHWRLC